MDIHTLTFIYFPHLISRETEVLTQETKFTKFATAVDGSEPPPLMDKDTTVPETLEEGHAVFASSSVAVYTF